MRLIDADELVNNLVCLKQDYEDEGCDSKRIDGIDDCIEEIRCTESADAVPVVHAHWIRGFLAQTGCYECSNCGRYSTLDTNYCGSCGAKMDSNA